jgi:hypothetical protein
VVEFAGTNTTWPSGSWQQHLTDELVLVGTGPLVNVLVLGLYMYSPILVRQC